MVREELPIDFLDGVARGVDGLAESLDCADVPVSVRLNPSKRYVGVEEWTDTVDWCSGEGRYLGERPQFTLEPVHWAGGYYVQEASSMVVGSIVGRILGDSVNTENTNEKIRVVDLCAAPGGKSTHLSSVVGGRGVVVANEVIRQRAGILAQNVVRWGEGNVVVTSSDAVVLAGAMRGSVDVLVVDAPCSGEGMFRKDMGARREWSLGNVELCAGRARRILADAVPMLRCGGYLVFSTCTFNRQENEETVEWLQGSGEWEVCDELLGDWGNGNGGVGRHFYPCEVRGEGLYVAVLRYKGDTDKENKQDSRERKNKRDRKHSAKKFSEYSDRKMVEVEHGGKLWGYPEGMVEIVEQLQGGRVQILYSGVEFGEMIRGTLKPSHPFALYAHRTAGLYPTTELPLEVAQEYLRKGNIDPSLLQEGLQIVTHRGLPLGFIKRIGNRANNLYPTSWRILNL